MHGGIKMSFSEGLKGVLDYIPLVKDYFLRSIFAGTIDFSNPCFASGMRVRTLQSPEGRAELESSLKSLLNQRPYDPVLDRVERAKRNGFKVIKGGKG